VGAMLREIEVRRLSAPGSQQVDAQAHEASVFDEAAFDDARKSSVTSMFPARSHEHGTFLSDHEGSLRLTRAAIGGRSAPSARVFLVRSQQQDGRCRPFLLFDGYDIVHVFLKPAQGASPARRTAMPSAMVEAAASVTWLAFGDRNFHRRRPRRLNSEELEFFESMALDFV